MRWDSRGVGFVLGMLAPLLGFAAYGGIYVTAIRLFVGAFRKRVPFIKDDVVMHEPMEGALRFVRELS